jgi:hypothetical protein
VIGIAVSMEAGCSDDDCRQSSRGSTTCMDD